MLAIAAAVLVAGCANVAPYGSDRQVKATRGTLEAPMVAKGPPLDGTLNSPVWQKCPPLVLGNVSSEEVGELKTLGRVLFTPTHLYVAWECTEPDTSVLKADAASRDEERLAGRLRGTIHLARPGRGRVPLRHQRQGRPPGLEGAGQRPRGRCVEQFGRGQGRHREEQALDRDHARAAEGTGRVRGPEPDLADEPQPQPAGGEQPVDRILLVQPGAQPRTTTPRAGARSPG